MHLQYAWIGSQKERVAGCRWGFPAYHQDCEHVDRIGETLAMKGGICTPDTW